MTTKEKLERLINYGTRYEIELSHPDGRRYLVKYTSRKSFQGLVAAMRSVGQSIVTVCGLTDSDRANRTREALTLGPWTIRFSGRTQRQAIIEGELPFVAA